MQITSLGFRTDIAILTASGSTVTDCGTHLLVTTPDNPSYHWGNFMLLRELPAPGGAREVMGAFDTWFATARHRAIGIDSPVDVDVSEFEVDGMDKDVSHVMTAERLLAPERPFAGGGIRPLTPDEWDKWVDLDLSVYAAEDRRYHRAYVEGRARQEQRLVAAGLGHRWGVFVDGRLAASAGLYDTGDGVFRFQSIATHPRRRGLGIATTLVHRMAERAVEEQGARQLVIVADPEGPAYGIYRRLGFETAEVAVELHQSLPGEIA
ncbi:GNAT family N-acetyltransferase [Nocardioides jishulii]|uniref:GNAT family N-acetyltransferase n=1 Tax=Nocardioides jishulii TaxID=2575440 RepID=A0A4U2YS63_9ACTN|nr:GNAT family N-acetyltransferase [Nocardioides jishulii]QCX26401.1 GNAT family N-acetyltransferase [Nocardioides jishulii]TKI63794.1 GNAT family N-acetyltransferase [Nocardioides jishulii]